MNWDQQVTLILNSIKGDPVQYEEMETNDTKNYNNLNKDNLYLNFCSYSIEKCLESHYLS